MLVHFNYLTDCRYLNIKILLKNNYFEQYILIFRYILTDTDNSFIQVIQFCLSTDTSHL